MAWVELDPVLGTEQAGRRPGLILTDSEYHLRSRRALVCPITKSDREWTFHVPIPLGLRVEGYVMVDQVRMVERELRVFEYMETLPDETVATVRGKLAYLVGISFQG